MHSSQLEDVVLSLLKLYSHKTMLWIDNSGPGRNASPHVATNAETVILTKEIALGKSISSGNVKRKIFETAENKPKRLNWEKERMGEKLTLMFRNIRCRKETNCESELKGEQDMKMTVQISGRLLRGKT